jgi:hypothetical protein
MIMADAAYFREKAQQCRELLKLATEPEVIEQLEIWVREFEERARIAQREASRD